MLEQTLPQCQAKLSYIYIKQKKDQRVKSRLPFPPVAILLFSSSIRLSSIPTASAFQVLQKLLLTAMLKENMWPKVPGLIGNKG